MLRTVILLVAILIMGCRQQTSDLIRNTNSGPALGTSYNIIYLTSGELDLQPEINAVFDAVNKSMSTYIPTSDISRINDGDTTVIVDQMFREVFESSKEVFLSTNGYFDPTVGILVNAWGFGPGKQIALDQRAVDSLLLYVGLDKVTITDSNHFKKQFPEIQIDFNAIAKGYTLDRLALLMDENEIDNYLIELGGEVVTKGENKLRGKLWNVGIEDPQQPGPQALKLVISLKNRALASSGNYRKFRVDSISGEKYVHTIDPKSGFTKNSKILGANVLAGKCAIADAYATAFMAMELDSSIGLLKKHKELDAYIIYLGENGETLEYMTPGFKSLLSP